MGWSGRRWAVMGNRCKKMIGNQGKSNGNGSIVNGGMNLDEYWAPEEKRVREIHMRSHRNAFPQIFYTRIRAPQVLKDAFMLLYNSTLYSTAIAIPSLLIYSVNAQSQTQKETIPRKWMVFMCF